MDIALKAIGTIKSGKSFSVELYHEYAAGLKGLSGFSHVLIIWYADKAPVWENPHLLVDKPYRLTPDTLGIFATRSPYRPNSICVSIAAVSSVNEEKGVVKLWWTDAEDGTPVIDIKPYHPSSDVVRNVKLPDWCSHWPLCFEESAKFQWDKEFLF